MDPLAARAYAFEQLATRLPADLYYHSIAHTEDVSRAVLALSALERVAQEDVVLLETAAAYHDVGFVWQYHANEQRAADLAQQVLPGFGFSPEQIRTVYGLIMATQVPQRPHTHLEEIMCDADLDYLGREDFYMNAHGLYREWSAYGTKLSLRQWYELQMEFLQAHHYFTASARTLREAGKQRHIEEIRELLSSGRA